MYVILGQVRGDRAEHREATGDTSREGHRRGLVRLEGDDTVREFVEISQTDTGQHRVRVERARDRLVTHVKFAQLLAKELIPRDTHATDAHDLLEEFNRVLFCLRVLLCDRFAQLIDTLGYFVREFHFAARVEHDLPAVFFEFTVDAKLVDVFAHLVPLHSVVASTQRRIVNNYNLLFSRSDAHDTPSFCSGARSSGTGLL